MSNNSKIIQITFYTLLLLLCLHFYEMLYQKKSSLEVNKLYLDNFAVSSLVSIGYEVPSQVTFLGIDTQIEKKPHLL